VAGLEPEYDLQLQIQVLGKIRERHPRAGLVIAGSGSQELELRRQIESTAYSEHVLLYGDMPHAITLRMIDESDVLLRTTHYDGDSIAVREALALGTPVIATDTAPRPPDVRLIPARDPAALQVAIEHTLMNPVAAKSSNTHHLDDGLAAVIDLYTELVQCNAGLDPSPALLSRSR
jgi:glycosyltransferase involved in cell wall biosynthesis